MLNESTPLRVGTTAAPSRSKSRAKLLAPGLEVAALIKADKQMRDPSVAQLVTSPESFVHDPQLLKTKRDPLFCERSYRSHARTCEPPC